MTRFSVIESVQHLIEQYRSFIKSSYRLTDPRLRAQFDQMLRLRSCFLPLDSNKRGRESC
jgi:hypothetical protein